MDSEYHPGDVEEQTQQFWENHNYFRVKEDLSREKFYCLAMLPYPSGDLHVGHVRNYTLSDVISRYQHMLGKNVMQPMGWDSFGLPAENAAIKHQATPDEWTQKNIDRMRKQLKRLGFAIDWSREISTCEPSYYQWEQWLFVRLYKKGLIYKKNAIVNWDPVDQTVLANEQVVDGRGWRSGALVEQREIPQWFFKITDYAEELLSGLDDLTQWPKEVVAMQRHWIGQSKGLTIQLKLIQKTKQYIDVYTTRPDTFMGVTYVAISMDHPIAKQQAAADKTIARFIKANHHQTTAEADCATQEKKGIFAECYVRHPMTKDKLPVWICNYVLMSYGTGAVMAVPAHDARDFDFAQQHDLPITPVIRPEKGEWDFTKAAYLEPGIMYQSGEFDGIKSKTAIKKIAQQLIDQDCAEWSTQYRLHDWGISRQRYWGTPIPMIQCKHCGEVPVPEDQLPVELPRDLMPSAQGSVLNDTPDFYKTTCPVCGRPARRDTDTMDTFVESSWYYARYCCHDQAHAMLDSRANYWTPVDYYLGGVEHAVLHLLYARFMHKVLRDEGLVNSDEPFSRLLTQGMVLKNGVKMSKSKGNTVSPTALIKKYGADTLRFFQVFASPPEQTLEWSDGGIDGAHRFLHKIWNFCDKSRDVISQGHPIDGHDGLSAEVITNPHYLEFHSVLQQANYDMERSQFNTVASACMKLFNIMTQLTESMPGYAVLLNDCTSVLLRLLAPICPHITHVLWQQLGFSSDVFSASWPKANIQALQMKRIEMVVQINGKRRAVLDVSPDLTQEAVESMALDHNNIKRYLEGETIKKIIVVPKRLVNIVV